MSKPIISTTDTSGLSAESRDGAGLQRYRSDSDAKPAAVHDRAADTKAAASSPSRRRLLGGLGGSVAAAGLSALGGHAGVAEASGRQGQAGATAAPAQVVQTSSKVPGRPGHMVQVTDAPISDRFQQRVPCLGVHQAGIVTPRPTAGMVASFFVLAQDREELERLFRTLTKRIVFLTQGGREVQLDPRLPPASSGLLGPVVSPDALTITVSLGESMFDERFGLARLRPRHLQRMTAFPNDALNAALCHGDLSIQFCANTPDTINNALRDVIKNLPDLLVLHWKQEGNVPPVPARPGQPMESARNFLGFRDGSANPDSADTALMDEVVWVGKGKGEPAWTEGGSYQAVRIIRNFVERWDRTPLQEQEAIFGRFKDSGAPLDGGKSEFDVPDYSRDPEGKKTPFDSHIRLANPRTPGSDENLMLRRPFNYSNGVTKSGQLEMGLLFICYQANLEKAFITVQKRLDGEPLEEYIKPVGGGYFFTLPGIRDPQDWLGRGLLEAVT
ncbi:MAG: iron uptake transporter deferrochelatase/peroxidase subunit [Lautropia sp.]|nr:iron uptake transporter deferrochelatase/peroxidase subunit [Lautropia sp.]